MSYKDDLQAPEWQRFRQKVFRRDNFQCCHCGSEDNLTAHHVYYAMGRKPWEYDLKDLLTLCQSCHFNLEKERENLNQIISSMNHHEIRILWKRLSVCIDDIGVRRTISLLSSYREIISNYQQAGPVHISEGLSSLFHLSEWKNFINQKEAQQDVCGKDDAA